MGSDKPKPVFKSRAPLKISDNLNTIKTNNTVERPSKMHHIKSIIGKKATTSDWSTRRPQIYQNTSLMLNSSKNDKLKSEVTDSSGRVPEDITNVTDNEEGIKTGTDLSNQGEYEIMRGEQGQVDNKQHTCEYENIENLDA